MKTNIGRATSTQLVITFQMRGTVIETYSQSMPIQASHIWSAIMEITAKISATPPSTQATGKPVNSSTIKLANMVMARISLISTGFLLADSYCPGETEQQRADTAQA